MFVEKYLKKKKRKTEGFGFGWFLAKVLFIKIPFLLDTLDYLGHNFEIRDLSEVNTLSSLCDSVSVSYTDMCFEILQF